MKEKEVLSLDEIKKQLSKIKEPTDKKEFLKGFIEDEDYKNIKRDLTKEIVPLLTKKPLKSYNLIYDSLSEGLEPIYFWTLDFMRDSSPAGLKLDVWKGTEDFEASVTSGYFGEMGQRTSLMQQKAMEYLGTINNLIKSILNLIYDLKEFEIRLDPYNDLRDEKVSEEKKQSARFSLKGTWMDQVDAKKGRGSINLLAQDLQFVTLRDAFFYVSDAKKVEDLDLNERVKNILKRKLDEFDSWKVHSESEIRKRYEIERIYLKAQAGTLKLYANWLKPYLVAAQKLKMRNATAKSLTNPNIVNSFSNMEIEIKLYGKKEMTPDAIHPSFQGLELSKKYFAVIEVVLKFRSVPSALSGQGGRQYVHGGRTDLAINAYCFDTTEMEAIESQELYEDLELVEDWVGTSLTKLQAEIEKYTKDVPKEEAKKPKPAGLENPFKGLFGGILEIYAPLREGLFPKKKGPNFVYKELTEITEEKAKGLAYTIYNTYKKTHGMLAT